MGALVVVVIVLAVISLRRPLLAVTPASPDAVLRDLAYRLRSSGRLVNEAPGRLEVGVNSLARLKVHVRATPRGTEVRYEVDATGVGWTVVLLLGGFGWGAIVGIAVALYIHFSASGFARDFVFPLLAAAPLGTPPPPTVATLLVEGLSEAQRLATEASEYEREAMQNGIGLTLLGSLGLFVLVLFGSMPFLGVSPVTLLGAVAISLATAGFGSWIVHQQRAPRVRELEAESSLYAAALAAEVLGYAAPLGPRPGLELLLRAAERSTYWREVRRRRKLWHDPIASFVIFLLAYGAFLFFQIAASLDFLPPLMRIGIGLLGALLVGGAVASFLRWRRRVREEDERDRQIWETRRAALETELWRILSG